MKRNLRSTKNVQNDYNSNEYLFKPNGRSQSTVNIWKEEDSYLIFMKEEIVVSLTLLNAKLSQNTLNKVIGKLFLTHFEHNIIGFNIPHEINILYNQSPQHNITRHLYVTITLLLMSTKYNPYENIFFLSKLFAWNKFVESSLKSL